MSERAWRSALERTRRAALGRLSQLLGTSEIDTETWEELESGLIQADVGAALTAEIVHALRAIAVSQGLTHNEQLRSALRTSLVEQFAAPAEAFPAEAPRRSPVRSSTSWLA